MPQKPYVIAVVEGGSCINVFAPDGTPITYDVLDHDAIQTANKETLIDTYRWLAGVEETERMSGLPITVRETMDKIAEDLTPDELALVENEIRSDRGRRALASYKEATGTGDEALGDLLTDLMHMAKADNYDYQLAQDRAEGGYREEAQGDGKSWREQIIESRTPKQNQK